MSSRQNEKQKKTSKATVKSSTVPSQAPLPKKDNGAPRKAPVNEQGKASATHEVVMPPKVSVCPQGNGGSSTGGDRGESANGGSETPARQCMNVLEKKLRNLEKRKGKLDDYRAQLANGATLNNAQLEAIEKFDVVVQNLEFVRDLQKQFQVLSIDLDKQSKKQARAEALERQRCEVVRMREVVRLFHFLEHLGSEETREALCSDEALGVNVKNLEQVDEFYSLITVSEDAELSVEDQLDSSAAHVVSYLSGLHTPVAGTTYGALLSLVQRVGGICALTCPNPPTNGHEQEDGCVDGGAQGGCEPHGSEPSTCNDFSSNLSPAVSSGS